MSDIGISLNCVSKNKHVPDIERLNLTVNQCVQSIQAAMTFMQI